MSVNFFQHFPAFESICIRRPDCSPPQHRFSSTTIGAKINSLCTAYTTAREHILEVFGQTVAALYSRGSLTFRGQLQPISDRYI